MTKVKSSKLLAVILAALLALSIAVVPAFAEGTTVELPEDNAAATEAAGENTEAPEATEAPASTEKTPDEGDKKETKKAPNWDLIISLGVIGLAIVVLGILFAVSTKFRERVKRFFREYKSELKKVVWSPWSDVKKNTVIVLVLSLGAALLIGVLDFVFSKGIIAIGTLIK